MRRTCTGSSRRRSSRRYYERDADGLPQRWLELMRRAIASTHLALLDDPHAPRVRRAAVPAGGAGRRRGGRPPEPTAGDRRLRRSPTRRPSPAQEVRRWRPGSRSRSRSTTTSRWATSAGSSPRSTTGPTSRCSRRWSATRASACRSTTRARCSSGCAPSARSSSTGSRALVARGQVEILGGGYYEPVLASLPERDRVGQLRGWRDELEALFGPPADAARGSPSASGSRTCRPRWPRPATTGRSSTTPHFRAAAIPEEDLWGAVHDRGPGPPADACSAPSRGCATGSRSGDVEEVIDYLRDHATEDGERVGMMGDDGEKFGAWPTTWEHCWGEGRWVERFFEALEANARLADDASRRRSGWTRHPPIGRVYVPTGVVRGDGRVGAAARRDRRRSPSSSTTRSPSRPARGALAARRVLAQLPGQVPRDQRPPQADAPDVDARSTAMTDGTDPDARARPPPPRPVERLLLARAVRRDLHQPHAPGDVRAPHRGRGRRRPRAGHARVAETRDLDLDGPPETSASPTRARSSRSTPATGAGIGGWDIRGGAARAGGGHAPPARGLPRDAPRARGEPCRGRDEGRWAGWRRRRPTPADGDDAGDESGPASIHEIVMAKEPGLADQLHYDPYERRSGLVRFLAADADTTRPGPRPTRSS